MKLEPYWWEDGEAPQSPAALPLPESVDVLIIGAGLTGLSAARTLAQAGQTVLVLDSGAPGIGASSRNGGMIGGGHRLSIDDMESRFGKDVALALLKEAHLESTGFARDLIIEEGIDCDYIESGRFRGLWRRAEYDTAARGIERLQTLIPLEAEMIPGHRQHEHVASKLYAGGIYFPRHGGLNPAKWVHGLLHSTMKAGAIVQGDTPVNGIESSASGWRIQSSRGRVEAGAVLAATNGYTPSFIPELKRRIVPIPSFIVATETLGVDRVRSLIPKGQMISESRDRHCYYRPSPDGSRLIFGARAAMFNVPDSFARREMQGLINQVFPDLVRVEFTHSWRGRTGFSFDFLPNVGCLNGIWHAMGYSGSGNTMAPYLGHKVALRMLGDAEGDTAFSKTGFPIRWWHRGRPWFLPFADMSFRLKDGWNNLQKDR